MVWSMPFCLLAFFPSRRKVSSDGSSVVGGTFSQNELQRSILLPISRHARDIVPKGDATCYTVWSSFHSIPSNRRPSAAFISGSV
jgi:hypothetical protein